MNGSEPRLSIIVPVYMVGDLVRTCVESILSQDFGNYELILVDDGSTDQSGSICDEFATRDHRVSVIHKENGNSASARNAGLDRAKGEFVVFVDADDSLPVGALRTMLARGEASRSDLTVFSFSANGKRERPTILPMETNLSWEEALRRLLLYRFPSQPWAKLYRRSLFDGLRFDPRAQFGQDLICNLDILLLKHPRIACFPDVVYNYVLRPTSNSFRNRFEVRYRVLSELATERLETLNAESAWTRELAAFRVINLVQTCFKTGKPPKKVVADDIFCDSDLNPRDLGPIPRKIAERYRHNHFFGIAYIRLRLLRGRVARFLKGGLC